MRPLVLGQRAAVKVKSVYVLDWHWGAFQTRDVHVDPLPCHVSVGTKQPSVKYTAPAPVFFRADDLSNFILIRLLLQRCGSLHVASRGRGRGCVSVCS